MKLQYLCAIALGIFSCFPALAQRAALGDNMDYIYEKALRIDKVVKAELVNKEYMDVAPGEPKILGSADLAITVQVSGFSCGPLESKDISKLILQLEPSTSTKLNHVTSIELREKRNFPWYACGGGGGKNFRNVIVLLPMIGGVDFRYYKMNRIRVFNIAGRDSVGTVQVKYNQLQDQYQILF